MENTEENRLKFYAQHLGQKIIIDSDCFSSEGVNDIIHTTLVSVSLKGIECDGWIPETEHTALELKPLSSITDEDAKQIAILCNVGIGFFSDSRAIRNGLSILKVDNIPQRSSDYLRSKGYALPWMGLSVEKMIEYGWIKLKSE